MTPIDPGHFDALAYVTAVAPAIGFELSPARLADIADTFAMVMRVGAPALAMQIPGSAEPAPVFVA